jgi:hypothetical protein
LLEQYIDPKGLLLDEMAFDPTSIIKHELTYTTFFHVCAKERKKSPIHYIIQVFMSLNVPFKKWKDSTTFVDWELLVLKLKTCCHSHAIIQSLNINLLHKHYRVLQHNHNLQTSHILHFQKIKNWKNISIASIRQNMIVYMSLTNMVVEWCTITM